MNKKADFASLVYIVIFIFIIGVVFFFVSKLTNEIFSELEVNINSSYSNTEAISALQDIKSSNQSAWDYAFLGIFLGSLIAVGIMAYSVRISPVFYWIYGLMSLFILGLGVILSNIWQDLAAEPDFATTLSQFPITNTLLGSYYPLAVVAIIMIMMIILFGKPPGTNE